MTMEFAIVALSVLMLATYTHSQQRTHGHLFSHFIESEFSGGPNPGFGFLHPSINFPPGYGYYQFIKLSDIVIEEAADLTCASLLPAKSKQRIDTSSQELAIQCMPRIQRCRIDGYRTMDGSCNNLRNPRLGAANTPYVRLLPAKYADGVLKPAVSVTGTELKSARLISDTLFLDSKQPDPLWTISAMQYGQIITHDMAMAAGTTQGKAHSTKCCTADLERERSVDERDPACFPIPVSADDPIFSKIGQRCMEFVRSTNDIFQGCNIGVKPADQISAVSAYLDSSNVYGSSEDLANQLREFRGGRLRVEIKGGRSFPPTDPNKNFVCDHVAEEEACYLAGDSRANQNPQLTIFQVLLLREHNRVAQALQQMNPHWNDERLYQETRKICNAEHQMVTYYEWLPIFIGDDNSLKNKVIYDTDGYVQDYNPKVNPSILNSFSGAAFRHLHTNIQGFIGLYNEQRSSSSALRLSDHFNRPQIIEEGNNFDDLARGMYTQPQDAPDKFFTTEITWFLFRNNKTLGQDLRAIDIQRCRDHGLASYNDHREFCGLPKAHTFEDFLDLISAEDVNKLKQLYAHPDDVDLVVGGSLEKLAHEALLGPTYVCIITEQFYRTRVGDRFFFENPKQFTLAQLNEVRKGSISRLMCDNGDNVQQIQARGFEKVSSSNPLVPCSQIPTPSLEPWREQPPKGIFQHPPPFSHRSDSPFFQQFKK